MPTDIATASEFKYYKCSLGGSARLITSAVTIVLALFVLFLIYRIVRSAALVEIIVDSSLFILISSLYVRAYLFHPSSYLLGEQELIINRLIRNIIIPFSTIKAVTVVNKQTMEWTERMGGNGGLFGFYGNFKTAFGMTSMYATRLENYILIETTDGENIIITPDDISLARELRQRI